MSLPLPRLQRCLRMWPQAVPSCSGAMRSSSRGQVSPSPQPSRAVPRVTLQPSPGCSILMAVLASWSCQRTTGWVAPPLDHSLSPGGCNPNHSLHRLLLPEGRRQAFLGLWPHPSNLSPRDMASVCLSSCLLSQSQGWPSTPTGPTSPNPTDGRSELGGKQFH